jgi:hypothetical protein
VLPHAQVLVLASWAVAGLGLIGLGALVRRLWHAEAGGADDLLLSFWLGWACLVLWLQAWHLVHPIDGAARTACTAAAGLGLLAAGPRPWIRIGRGAGHDLLAVSALVALAVWLSNHALGGARYGDVGAYFVPTVRWLVEQPIVPGLANLHAHYALNQSYFGYVALLETGPFAHRSYHLANGLLVLVLGIRVVLALSRLTRLRRAAAPPDVFYALLAPGVFALAVSIWLTSPSPDVGVFALGSVASGESIALLTDQPRRRRFHLRALALLAAAGVTVKLSFVGFAAALVPVAFGLWLRHDRPGRRAALRELAGFTLLGVVAIGPWLARNAVMSGLPLYPSAVIALPVEWRVGTDVEGWLRNTVYVGGWRAIVRTPGWFLGILRNQGWNAPEVAGPIAIGAVALLAAVLRRTWRRARGRAAAAAPRDPLPLAVIVPALASLAFCVVMSPVPRYAGATVWVLAAIGILLAAGPAIERGRSALRPLLLLAIVAATAGTLHAGMDPLWLPLRDFETVSPFRWKARRLKTGSVVNVPIGVEACGDAPLPCTPYPNPALRWRRDGDLAAGFMLDPALRARYRYDPGRSVLR